MIAVLTGDIVRSTKMSERQYQDLIQLLREHISTLSNSYQARGQVYRGDEFQIHFPDPDFAIKQTILLKLLLITSPVISTPIHCTLSLAFGQHSVMDASPGTSTGPVYVDSGRKLDTSQREALVVTFSDCQNDPSLTLLTSCISHQLNKLTQSQAELLHMYIDSDFVEHQKLADKLGTSRQNISNRLSSMGAHLIRDYIQLINQKLR
ncbi:hypothetical protein J1N51_03285 [Psychrosphaera ytuae]|uniref:Uncharacterized protein n=1 Tax=Psychrosphaera ytuae TaxID=2820710 RepID=A0A975HIT5_9GAMM|nr:hypothetical protein [Psychrosphaera ytuae]QTH64513.1 hypothetical protein J1N51_03285 [Psychrosphaera ytuae]